MILLPGMRWLLKLQLLKEMSAVITKQREILQERNFEIEVLKQKMLRQQLENERRYLELVIVFRRQLDEPDYDISEKLEGMICDVSDFVARMEEQIV